MSMPDIEPAGGVAACVAPPETELQLRLPMTPLPHCAGQPSFLETYELQPELLS